MKANAQSPNLLWTATLGDSSAFNQSLDCDADNTGNLFVVGYTNWWPHGDYLVLKYNAETGDTIWTKTFNGNPNNPSNDNDIAMGCVVDASGNLYVTGMSSNVAGNFDILTIKFNGATGDTLWTCRFDGAANGYDAGTKCALDASGNLYITGLSFTGAYTDFCMIKYNAANGNFIWSHNYPSPLGNKGEAYGCSLNGSTIFINGYVYTGTAYKLFTVKCDTGNGDTLWTRVNNETLDSLQFIHSGCVADNSGNVYVVGNCSNAIKGVYGRIIKYDASGNVTWTKMYENPIDNTLNDALYGCTLDLTGNLITTGTTLGTSTFLNNFITIRYNAATGDTIWTKPFDGRGGVSCTVDSQGYIYVTGAPHNWQCLTLKYDNTGMVEIMENNNNISNKLYPNPSSGLVALNINHISNTALTLSIYNVNGELIRSETLQQNQEKINIADLNNGIYIIEIRSGEWSEKRKLVVQK